MMPLRKQLGDVLSTITDLDKSNGGIYVIIIYDHFRHLSKTDITYSLNELLIDGLIEESVKPDGVKFRLLHITKRGLEKSAN